MKKSFFLLSILVIISQLVSAQVAGTLDTTSSTVTYNTQFLNITLDPSPKIGLASRKQIIENISTGTSNLGSDIGYKAIQGLFPSGAITGDALKVLNGIGTITGSSITPVFDIGGSADFGAYFEVNRIGSADLNIDYPIGVRVIYPAANTFACGDEFIIQTEWYVRQKANMLKVNPPFLEMEVGPIIQNVKVDANIGLSLSACLGATVAGKCLGISTSWSGSLSGPSHTFNTPTLPPLLRVCDNAFGTNHDDFDLLACVGGNQTLFGWARALYDYRNPNHLNFSFSTITPTKIDLEIPDHPAFNLPEMSAEFNKVTNADLNYQSLNSGKTLRVYGTRTNTAKYRFDLVSLLEYAKVPTSKSLGGGLASYDIGDVAPTISTDQVMDFTFTPRVQMAVDLGVSMKWEVHDASLGLVSTGNSQYVNLLAGQWIKAVYPQHLSQPSTVQSTSQLKAKFKTWSNQHYYFGMDVSFIELAVGSYKKTIYEDQILKKQLPGSPDVLQNHTLNLNDFDVLSLQDFALDPENPIVDVDYIGIADILNIGNGEKLVVYRIDFSNGGDVKLNELRLDLDLSNTFNNAQFYVVECLNSNQLQTNNAYDGYGDKNLLGAGNALDVGENATVEVLVRVKPEISKVSNAGCFGKVEYDAITQAFGTSPIGTSVQSNVYQCTDTRTADDDIATVDLGAAVIKELSDFTIYGWDEVKFDKELALSKGNVGSNQKIVFENVSQGHGTPVTIVGDLHAQDQVFIQGESQVIADYVQSADAVKMPNKKSSLTLNGTLSENSSCVASVTFPNLQIPSNRSRKRVQVKDHDTLYLSPGAYGEVRLNAHSVLVMTAGTYDIDRWLFMKSDAEVLYDVSGGEVILNLGKWQPLGRNNLQFKLKDSGLVEAIQYNYVGTQPAHFNHSLVQGVIIAPSAEIEFDDYSRLEGNCYAAKVNFKRNSSFLDEEYLVPLNIDPKCQALPASALEAYDENPATGNQDAKSIPLNNEAVSAAERGVASVPNLKLYPNPAKNKVSIVSNGNITNFRLYNALGQEFMNEQVHAKRIDIHLNQVVSGFYYIDVWQDGVKHTFKLVKL